MGKLIRKIIWYVALFLSLGGVLYSGQHLTSYYLLDSQARKEYSSLRDIGHSNSSAINFTELIDINPDIVGWILIEGTNIDYPIVQGEDNEKYLTTTFFGTSNPSGSIFMDKRNALDFSDRHTLIYGHHMKNKMMFEPLINYQEQAFYEEHPIITIFTVEGEFQYEILSAYVTLATSDTYTLEFQQDADFEDYLQFIKDLSIIKTDVEVTSADRIITLSTCDYQFNNARMVVHGRLVQ